MSIPDICRRFGKGTSDETALVPDAEYCGDVGTTTDDVDEASRKMSGFALSLPWGRMKAVLHSDLKSEGTDFPDKKTHKWVSLADYPLPELSESEIDWVVTRYWLNPPFSYVAIKKDWQLEYVYEIVEPKLTSKELIILEETYGQLKSMLVFDRPRKQDEMDLDNDTMGRIIRSFDPEIVSERIDILIYYLRRNFLGYGTLDPLMHDPNIEDITCNGPGIPIFIYHRKFSNIRTNIIYSDGDLNRFILKIAQKADKQVSLTNPLVDAALPGGARAQITYSDVVTSRGSSFTIRKFKADPMTPVDLIRIGTYDFDLMAAIWLAVENGKSMIITGGTASGKTSTMNAVSFFIPSIAKIVSIEDTREIQLPHLNWLAMHTRESAAVSKGDINMFGLLKASLRQRPEYIIVGEVRGEEAQTLFQAMNSGHTTFSTLHAGDVREAINRLTHDPINVPKAMFGALDLMIIQGLQHDTKGGFRRCISFNEMIADDGNLEWNPLYEWDCHTDCFLPRMENSAVFNDIMYSHGWSIEQLEEELRVRKDLLQRLVKNNVSDAKQISHFISELRKRRSNEHDN